jgi:hypothetical protein
VCFTNRRQQLTAVAVCQRPAKPKCVLRAAVQTSIFSRRAMSEGAHCAARAKIQLYRVGEKGTLWLLFGLDLDKRDRFIRPMLPRLEQQPKLTTRAGSSATGALRGGGGTTKGYEL